MWQLICLNVNNFLWDPQSKRKACVEINDFCWHGLSKHLCSTKGWCVCVCVCMCVCVCVHQLKVRTCYCRLILFLDSEWHHIHLLWASPGYKALNLFLWPVALRIDISGSRGYHEARRFWASFGWVRVQGAEASTLLGAKPWFCIHGRLRLGIDVSRSCGYGRASRRPGVGVD